MTRQEIIKLMRDIAPIHTTHWARDASGTGHWFMSKPHAGDVAWLTRGELYLAPAWRREIRGSWDQTRIAFREEGAEESMEAAPEETPKVCVCPSSFYCTVPAFGSATSIRIAGAMSEPEELPLDPPPEDSAERHPPAGSRKAVTILSRTYASDMFSHASFAGIVRLAFDHDVIQKVGKEMGGQVMREVIASIAKNKGNTLHVYLLRGWPDATSATLSFYWE